jgi:hypothetical protein
MSFSTPPREPIQPTSTSSPRAALAVDGARRDRGLPSRWFEAASLLVADLGRLAAELTRASVPALSPHGRDDEMARGYAAVVSFRDSLVDRQRLMGESTELSIKDALAGIANRRRLDEVLLAEWQRSCSQGRRPRGAFWRGGIPRHPSRPVGGTGEGVGRECEVRGGGALHTPPGIGVRHCHDQLRRRIDPAVAGFFVRAALELADKALYRAKENGRNRVARARCSLFISPSVPPAPPSPPGGRARRRSRRRRLPS